MEDPEAIHTPPATVQYGFHKKTMRQHLEKILYPKRKAMLCSTTLSWQRVEHPGLRLTMTGMESSHAMKAVELQLKHRPAAPVKAARQDLKISLV